MTLDEACQRVADARSALRDAARAVARAEQAQTTAQDQVEQARQDLEALVVQTVADAENKP